MAKRKKAEAKPESQNQQFALAALGAAVAVAAVLFTITQGRDTSADVVVIPEATRSDGVPVTQRTDVACCGLPRRHVDSLSLEALALGPHPHWSDLHAPTGVGGCLQREAAGDPAGASQRTHSPHRSPAAAG